MDVHQLIGRRIANLRKLSGAGMTQAELAKRAGISRQTVSNVEQGRVDATVGTLYAIAQALGESLSELVQEPTVLTIVWCTSSTDRRCAEDAAAKVGNK